MSKPKRPRDPLQLAKQIGDIATGQANDVDPDAGKNPAAVALGKRGGRARATKLTPEQRSASAKRAVAARRKVKRPIEQPSSAVVLEKRHSQTRRTKIVVPDD